MNRMRDKTHIILIVLVLAFLATIIFNWGMDYFGMKGQQYIIFGSVNGEEINQKEFESKIQQYIDQQKQQTGEDPDENTVQMIRDQMWEQTVIQILANQEINRMGIKVTDEEILKIVYNSPQSLPDDIKRYFIDSTGQFNMSIYQQALATKTPEVEKFWSSVETQLRQTLLLKKLESVIEGSVRIPEADVLQKFKDENILASFNYIFLDVQQIPDNQIQITENDLREYYNKNKDDFKTDESVKLKYILFSDNPTGEDSTLTQKRLKALTKDLKFYTVKDTNFINLVNENSLTKFNDTTYFKPNELSPEVVQFLFGAKKDSVSDVIKANDGFHMIKFLDSKEGEDVYTNVSHILVNFGIDTNASKAKAEEIFKRLKSGEDFSKLAGQLSDDQATKLSGGNIGWFTKGTKGKDFEETVNKGKIGEIVGPIKSQNGYEIVKILDRQKKIFKFADIKQIVKASIKTRDAVRKRAEDFAYVANKENFDDEAKKDNLQIIDIPPITKSSFIQGAGQNTKITKFAFDEKVKSISEPLKIQGGYAVYTIIGKTPSGYLKFEDVKDNGIVPRVKIEKKLELLKQKAFDIRSKISGNNILSLKNVDPNINIQSIDTFSVARGNQQIGNDYEFDNALFKLSNGQISDPIKTQKGYYIVQVKNITPFDEAKYSSQSESIRASLTAQKKQTVLQEWVTALKDKAVIIDNRDKYYR